MAAVRDKHGREIVVLDLRGISDVTDWFVICHGASDRQVGAIVDHVLETLRTEHGLKPAHVEGDRSAAWVLMDYIDFVVHVFQEEKRRFYRIERLWGDAPQLDLGDEGAETAVGRPGAAP